MLGCADEARNLPHPSAEIREAFASETHASEFIASVRAGAAGLAGEAETLALGDLARSRRSRPNWFRNQFSRPREIR